MFWSGSLYILALLSNEMIDGNSKDQEAVDITVSRYYASICAHFYSHLVVYTEVIWTDYVYQNGC